MALAIPSSLTLRRVLCPIAVRDSVVGMMLGVVRRMDGRAVPRATIVFAWSDFDLDRATAVATPKQLTASVTADSVGVYRACGLPLARPLSVQVQLGANEQSGVIEEEIGDVGVRVLDLRIGSASAGSATARADAASTTASAASATDSANALTRYALRGRVQGVSGKPISSAHVRLFGTTLEATTNEQGEFHLAGLPGGTQGLEIVALAYAPRRVSVDVDADTRPVTVTLDRSSVVLDSVVVTAKRISHALSRANKDFDLRAKRGLNQFITEDQIARRRPFYTSDLLRTVAGVRVVRKGFDVAIVSTRGNMDFQNRECPMSIFLDGTTVDASVIADLPPEALHGVEIVSSGSGAPSGYKVGWCGAIFVWTK